MSSPMEYLVITEDYEVFTVDPEQTDIKELSRFNMVINLKDMTRTWWGAEDQVESEWVQIKLWSETE